MVRLDFETKSELDVRDVGAYLYANHTSTRIVCFSFQIDDGPIYLWHPYTNAKLPQKLFDSLKTRKLEAHNAFFEYCIWTYVCRRQFTGWPELPFLHYDCSAAKAAAMALPRALGDLCKALGTDVQKDEIGKRTMLKVARPRKPTKKDPDTKWHETPKDLNTVFAYNKDDVRAEAACSRILKPLTTFQRRIWELDQRMNLRGVLCDRKGVEAALSLIGQYEAKLTTELRKITYGQVYSAGALKQIQDYLNRQGVSIPNLQKSTVSEYLNSDLIQDENARRVLEIRQKLSQSSTKKYQAMLTRMSPVDDRIRDILLFNGASTGRWAGRGIQLQNLPRGNGEDQDTCIEVMYLKDLDFFEALYPDVLSSISNCIRGMLIASPGHILRSIDYAAIEARVLAWIVGEEWVLDIFKTTGKIYEATASSIYGVDISEITKAQRQIGKVADLALGYQGGVGAFQTMAKNYGVIVDDKEADSIKIKWRKAHPKTVKFWKDLQNAAIHCVRTKRSVGVGKVCFIMDDRFMRIRLPSGRTLYYCDPTIREVDGPYGPRETFYFWYVDSQTKRWVNGSAYGGMLAENITQAVAFDLLAEAMLKLEENNYTSIFSVHDEDVTEDEKTFGSLKEIKDIMLDAPEWAHGLPLAAEGWEGFRYHK